MFGLNAGSIAIGGDHEAGSHCIRGIDHPVDGIDRYDMVVIHIKEVYASVGILVGEGVRSADVLSYALGRMAGEEACEFRKGLERAAGAESEEDLGVLYDKLDVVRRFIRRIPGDLRCV